VRARLAIMALSLVIAVAMSGIAAAAASAAALPKNTGKLSPRLVAFSSAAYGPLGRAAKGRLLSLPGGGPGAMMQRDGRAVVSVYLRDSSAATRSALRVPGATMLSFSGRYAVAGMTASPAALRRLAALPGVRHVEEVLMPMTAGAGSGAARTAAACGGSVTSEADIQLHTAVARKSFGVSGAGIKVGVLSDSYDVRAGDATDAAGDVATGDLPGAGNPCGRTTPVQVVDEINSPASGFDEGRAMLQLIHDLAPDSPLAFATAFDGDVSFANNIRALQTAGSRVIADDVTYFNEPFFQDGPISVAVNDVTSAGAVYYSSAANSNVIVAGNDVASWEAPAFRTMACPPTVAGTCMDFDPGAGTDNGLGVTLAPGGGFRLDMQWAEPWYGVTDDLDVLLLNSLGSVVAGSQAGIGVAPFELFGYTNTTGVTANYTIVIRRFSGTGTPRTKFVLLGAGGVTAREYPTGGGGDVVGPTIFGHNGTANAMSTAAVPYDNSSIIETYSSRGPVTHYFGPVLNTVPAPPLASPEVLAKPDIAATDGAATTFFAQNVSGIWRFFGTSAAAPHAAAVAALMLDGFPSATVAQVKNAERTTAHPVGAFGATAAGAGLVDAKGAVSSLLPAASINDVSAAEGNSGTKVLTFTVTLSKANTANVVLKYGTAAGTAGAADFVARKGSITFSPGQVSKTIQITVNGDTAVEPNETFTVNLKKPVRAKLADKSGTGTILNDD
jgi:hypothetical protein